MPKTDPIDPAKSPRYVLDGRVVTMNANSDVLESGRIYIDAGSIQAVRPRGEPRPSGFRGAPVIKTGDTIYPGMIELHNHLSYNALPMWNVPKRYGNRGQWGRHEALVRYVEGKCLLGVMKGKLSVGDLLRRRLFPSVVGLPNRLMAYYRREIETRRIVNGRRHELRYAF